MATLREWAQAIYNLQHNGGGTVDELELHLRSVVAEDRMERTGLTVGPVPAPSLFIENGQSPASKQTEVGEWPVCRCGKRHPRPAFDQSGNAIVGYCEYAFSPRRNGAGREVIKIDPSGSYWIAPDITAEEARNVLPTLVRLVSGYKKAMTPTGFFWPQAEEGQEGEA